MSSADGVPSVRFSWVAGLVPFAVWASFRVSAVAKVQAGAPRHWVSDVEIHTLQMSPGHDLIVLGGVLLAFVAIWAILPSLRSRLRASEVAIHIVLVLVAALLLIYYPAMVMGGWVPYCCGNSRFTDWSTVWYAATLGAIWVLFGLLSEWRRTYRQRGRPHGYDRHSE